MAAGTIDLSSGLAPTPDPTTSRRINTDPLTLCNWDGNTGDDASRNLICSTINSGDVCPDHTSNVLAFCPSRTTSPQIEETYYINVDTYKAITLPTYDLTPPCNKELTIYFTDAKTNLEITWINFNSTTNAYEIYSDDVTNTGTYIINTKVAVKNYVRNTYASASET
jgi:hypothetical protein